MSAQSMSLLFYPNINNTFIHELERKFESPDYVNSLRNWMNQNWSQSILYAILYILLIFAGRSYMHTKEKFELRGLLAAWNIILAVFSLIGTMRLVPELINGLTQYGFEYTICDNSFAYGITGFWSYLFVMSKLVELVDTVFIVLRKQPLIFLHWYHHATVLVYCWYSYHDFSSSGRWFACMNYFVHTIMYGYYALKSLKFNLSKHISKFITTLQLIQMIIGCIVNYYAWKIKNENIKQCSITYENIKYSFLMYFSYFLLFFNFFINAYIVAASKKRNVKAKTN